MWDPSSSMGYIKTLYIDIVFQLVFQNFLFFFIILIYWYKKIYFNIFLSNKYFLPSRPLYIYIDFNAGMQGFLEFPISYLGTLLWGILTTSAYILHNF
jgi:hypothetical protein